MKLRTLHTTLITGSFLAVAGCNPTDTGDYTLAYNCDANQDDPEADDSESMAFHDKISVSVKSSTTATVDFPQQ